MPHTLQLSNDEIIILQRLLEDYLCSTTRSSASKVEQDLLTKIVVERCNDPTPAEQAYIKDANYPADADAF